MNPYAVRFSRRALNQLTEIWLAAGSERDAVTAAASRIETLLANDPTRHGKPEHEGFWKIEVLPLHVLFTVTEESRQVRVVRVRKLNPPFSDARSNGEVQPPDKEG